MQMPPQPQQNKENVYVIGHTMPDTDSICSAIGYAYFKNFTDKRFLYTAARAGRISEETKFVLDRFGVPAPVEVTSLSPTASDLKLREPISASERDSVHALAGFMQEKGLGAVPVVNEAMRVSGIVGLRDIARFLMAIAGLTDLSQAPISLDIFLKTLQGRALANPREIETLSGRVMIASIQRGTLANMMHEGDIIVVGDRQGVQLDCMRAGCSALIVTDGAQVGADIIRKAHERGVLVISSPHSAFATVQLLLMSEPLTSIMTAGPATAGLFTPIPELRKQVLDSSYRAAIVTDSDDRLISMVTRTDLLDPVRKRAILVDHNEVSLAVDGVEDAEILEIIDHHRVGDISTAAPIYVLTDPVGSTCTIVAREMFLSDMKIPTEIAGLLLSGILSDTLNLTLSTTSRDDRDAAARLAGLAGISIDDYARDLLMASINIEDKTPAELVAADFRKILLGGKKLGVGQMMVLDHEEIDSREGDMLKELKRLQESKGYDLVVMLVTNPLDVAHERVIAAGETWIIEEAFGVDCPQGFCRIPLVLSRKRDFIPAVDKVLSGVAG